MVHALLRIAALEGKISYGIVQSSQFVDACPVASHRYAGVGARAQAAGGAERAHGQRAVPARIAASAPHP